MLSTSSLSAFLAVLLLASQGHGDGPTLGGRSALVPATGLSEPAPRPDCVMPNLKGRAARRATQAEH